MSQLFIIWICGSLMTFFVTIMVSTDPLTNVDMPFSMVVYYSVFWFIAIPILLAKIFWHGFRRELKGFKK